MNVFERSQAIVRHAEHVGDSVENFYLDLSRDEANGLLAWFSRDSLENPSCYNGPLLRQEIAQAIENHDPYSVLQHLHLNGVPLRMHEECTQ